MQQFKRFIPLIAFSAFGLLLWWALTSERDIQAIPSPLIDRSVPTFELPSLHSSEVQLNNSIFEGRVSLLNFWGSWCVVCIDEHPFLNQLAEQGVDIIGVNYDDTDSDALAWLEQRGNPYTDVLAERNGQFVIDLGVYGAPETFLVDKSGIIRYKHVGQLTPELWAAEIEPLYKKLISEVP